MIGDEVLCKHLQSLRSKFHDDTENEGEGSYFNPHPFEKRNSLVKLLSQKKIEKLDTPIPQSFIELAELSLLLGKSGGELAKKALSLHSFPSFGSKEALYNDQDAEILQNLLLEAFQKQPSKEVRGEYYQKIQKNLPEFFLDSLDFEEPFADLVGAKGLTGAFIKEGDRVSLGACRFGDIEVRAFGPQIGSLNDFSKFGVFKEKHSSSFAAFSGDRGVWLQLCKSLDEKKLFFKFYGLERETQASFVFYIRSSSSFLNGKRYFPRSLQTYKGESESVTFESEGAFLQFNLLEKTQMQLIPLSRDSGFWGSDFLLAYQLKPCLSSLSLEFTTSLERAR